MENRLTRCLYDHSPIFLQNMYVSVYGLRKRRQRYGGTFRRWNAFFRESAGWSLDELRAYQDEKVREVIRNAYDHVPFHRRRMQERGLTPDDVRGVADLPKLPFLEKADLRDAGDQMLSDAVPAKERLSALTSGSTGLPLMIHWTRDCVQREYGFHWARRRPGVRRGESYASFTGLQLVRAASMKPPFWRHNHAANQTCYSIFHVSPETIPLYLEEMQRRRHIWYEGYPSVVAILARYVLDRGIDWPCPPRAMFTEAEQLLPEHRDWIEQGFTTHIYNQYGQNEMASSATQYECGHMHYDMDYGVIEFLPVEEESGTVAEMVCTAFDNHAFPLIRYRIGDLALLPDEPVACDVHASPILLDVYGRTGHTLVSRDGRLIRNISVIVKRCDNVQMVQCIQEEPGRVEVRVLRGEGYSDADEQNLLSQFRRKMGEMDFDLLYVSSEEEFERTRRGKFLSIVSKNRQAAPLRARNHGAFQ